MQFLIEKWCNFDDKTTNLLKYAVFEINDWKVREREFSEDFGGDFTNYFWEYCPKSCTFAPSLQHPLHHAHSENDDR